MNKFIFGLMTVLLVSSFAMADGSISLGPVVSDGGTNKVVLPSRGLLSAPVMQVGARTNLVDTYVSSGGQVYFVASGGVATSAPSRVTGKFALDGTTLLALPGASLRDGLAVINNSTNKVYVSIGSKAVIGQGYCLSSEGASLVIQGGSRVVPQGQINVAADGTAGTVSALDW